GVGGAVVVAFVLMFLMLIVFVVMGHQVIFFNNICSRQKFTVAAHGIFDAAGHRIEFIRSIDEEIGFGKIDHIFLRRFISMDIDTFRIDGVGVDAVAADLFGKTFQWENGRINFNIVIGFLPAAAFITACGKEY